jgi:monoterpene epsilon-lactone hydrolase
MSFDQLNDLITQIRANLLPANPTVEFHRARAENRARGLGPVPEVAVQHVDANGVPAAWVTAPGVDQRRAILYLHGGGFIFGSLSSHKRLAFDISAACSARVLLVAYRLAPEHPFPAALEDSLTAWRWLTDQAVDVNRLSMAGDSAGAGLALAAMLKLREDKSNLPICAALVSPWVDLEANSESLVNRSSRDPMVQKEVLLWMADLYLNGADARAPYTSPVNADLRGLPPILVQSGTGETLLDDAIRIAERLHASDVQVKLSVWPNMIHVWPMFTPMLSEARDACEEIGEFIKKRTA